MMPWARLSGSIPALSERQVRQRRLPQLRRPRCSIRINLPRVQKRQRAAWYPPDGYSIMSTSIPNVMAPMAFSPSTTGTDTWA
jgi:hypothetical protein